MSSFSEALYAGRFGVDEMSDETVAGRISMGLIRLTVLITPEQGFDFDCGIAQEMVYLDFEGEHAEAR
jgi:hypothetical protein